MSGVIPKILTYVSFHKTQKLMEPKDEELDALPFLLSTGRRKKEKQDYLTVIGLHLLVFILYSLAIFLYLNSHTSQGRSSLIEMSFDQEELLVNQQYFELAEFSVYAGAPSRDLDNAWQELLSGINIRVSQRELERTNQTSVTLLNGQDHLAWLEAFHQLHCVKFVRQAIYRKHYFPDVSGDKETHWLLHADHCVELLRQAIMCHADTTLMTFEWSSKSDKPMLKLEGPKHTCVNWEDLRLKVQRRIVDDQEMSSLKNPSFLGEI
ncbi:uncharacterized protein EAF02_010275 [Botrytis sinoallii]|uniref:uncharacterized protein n=1 Tax=Botrytis sinoallii TaxID=1463999 RepID=UPI0019029298|nr:uncharacterized protein EAF02_010275 [Botrytis sinoallii]KAF7864307.1 hypothetical protein EAF02_010275 [Botrytis sinoallii]